MRQQLFLVFVFLCMANALSNYPSWSIDYEVCEASSECSTRMGRQWCCAQTECETDGYKSTSNSCELKENQGTTDLLGVKCQVVCSAVFLTVLAPILAFLF